MFSTSSAPVAVVDQAARRLRSAACAGGCSRPARGSSSPWTIWTNQKPAAIARAAPATSAASARARARPDRPDARRRLACIESSLQSSQRAQRSGALDMRPRAAMALPGAEPPPPLPEPAYQAAASSPQARARTATQQERRQLRRRRAAGAPARRRSPAARSGGGGAPEQHAGRPLDDQPLREAGRAVADHGVGEAVQAEEAAGERVVDQADDQPPNSAGQRARRRRA